MAKRAPQFFRFKHREINSRRNQEVEMSGLKEKRPKQIQRAAPANFNVKSKGQAARKKEIDGPYYHRPRKPVHSQKPVFTQLKPALIEDGPIDSTPPVVKAVHKTQEVLKSVVKLVLLGIFGSSAISNILSKD